MQERPPKKLKRSLPALSDGDGVAGGLDGGGLMEAAWIDVIQKMDETYARLVTYQVELEKKNADLEVMRQFMDSVLGSMTDILIVLDRDGMVLQVNEATRRGFGRDETELCGADVRVLFTSESEKALDEILAMPAEKVVMERTLHMAGQDRTGQDGAAPFEVRAAPRQDPRGRKVGTVLIGRPVGELRRAYEHLNETHEQLKAAQTQLVHAEKMASLGRLVTGVAHELNNPISFVYGNAHALERYIGRVESYFHKVWSGASREELVALRNELKIDTTVARLREATSGSLQGAERVRDIVESLRRFSAGGRGENEPFDLISAVQTSIGWVVKGREPMLELACNIPEKLMVIGRSGHIQQVVMNIVQNACDSVEGQARQKIAITIREAGGRAILRIADNGPGLSDEARSRMFEPFFTTKPVGKGTGLGLSISYKIIKDHGGTLTAFNAPEGGAVFEINLPVGGPGGTS